MSSPAEHGMIAHTDLPGVGLATMCTASKVHSPVPLRFVWHHLQPLEAGGQTVAANLVEICDSCHYSIHRLLWYMRLLAEGTALSPAQADAFAHPPRRAQLAFATIGYQACVAAGTVASIPNEG
jgi:HNH endonuclease